jgi:hypothetical protein
VQNLFTEIADRGEDTIRRAHRWAVALGSDHSGVDAATERLASCHSLMCRAAVSLIDVPLDVQAFELHVDVTGDPTHHLLRGDLLAIRGSSAAALRSAWRALEVHGRDVGYETTCWLDAAVEVTERVLWNPPRGGVCDTRPGPTAVARAASLRLTRGLAALAHDRMAVPEHLADVIGLTTAPFMLACELLER